MASATDDPIESGDAGAAQPADSGADIGTGNDGADDAASGADDAASVADDGASGSEAAASGADLLEREGEAAADYLEGLLDIIDADGDIDMDVDGDRAVVAVIGDQLRHLVGPGGAVLDALQELTRLAVARETGGRSRLMLDIGGYRARRRAELSKIGTQAAEKALSTGEPVALTPMSAFERKVVHDAVAAAGLRSESEGAEPDRYVVVLPTRRDAAAVGADTVEPNSAGGTGGAGGAGDGAATEDAAAGVAGEE